ncbi:MAG: hypothetical protein JWN73_2452 [Betaproteobacteria bacterium]|nr:hypothetical protein [Betaproteobacteria bacterium]
MPARLPGIAFGPGFALQGNAIEFDITDYGLRLVTEESFDGAPPWSEVRLSRRGYAGMLLEWPGSRGRYAISVTDRAAIGALAAARPAAGADRASRRRWPIWLAVVLGLLAALAFWQYDHVVAWAVSGMPAGTDTKQQEHKP